MKAGRFFGRWAIFGSLAGLLPACSEQPPKPTAPSAAVAPAPSIVAAPAPASSPAEAAEEPPPIDEKPPIAHSVLRSWRPGNEAGSLGLELLVEESDFSEQDVIELLKAVSAGKDPVRIRIYLSRMAYEQELSGNFGSEYKRGCLLAYIKNNRLGTNEIRWMQESGSFAEKFGTTTKL